MGTRSPKKFASESTATRNRLFAGGSIFNNGTKTRLPPNPVAAKKKFLTNIRLVFFKPTITKKSKKGGTGPHFFGLRVV